MANARNSRGTYLYPTVRTDCTYKQRYVVLYLPIRKDVRYVLYVCMYVSYACMYVCVPECTYGTFQLSLDRGYGRYDSFTCTGTYEDSNLHSD
jgi:hypothetical protein